MKEDKELPEVEETFPADAWSTVEGRTNKDADWLERAKQEYLDKGGRITKVPEGESGYKGGPL